MFADYHVHTEFSDDSVYEMEEVVKDAIQIKMEEICFTDHVDYGVKLDWNDKKEIQYRDGMPMANVYYPEYFETIKELQYLYGDLIAIKKGMEFGVQVHTISQYEKLFVKYPFDFIILSVHQIDNLELWTQDFQKGKSQKEYNEKYYQELLEIVKQYKNYSVLGHLDIIIRYDKNGTYPFEKISDIVNEILKIVIRDGKGIEVNTSSYRYGLTDMTPSKDILTLYKKLGGEIITIGSDSHKKGQLGAHIENTKKVLFDMGFRYHCTYENMRPHFHMIRDNNRQVAANPLVYNNGRYAMDFEGFERLAAQRWVKLFLLCSPHNPVGRVWTREELKRIRDICKRHGILVVSDEIHCDFVWQGHEHTCYGLLDEDAIVCAAPSKTFNLAGLQVSHIFVRNAEMRKELRSEFRKTGYGQLNAVGLSGCKSVYQKGAPWLDALKEYLQESIRYTKEFLRDELPKIKLVEPEGTYLLWLDFSAYELPQAELDRRITEGAGLWLDGGTMFGIEGDGFQRVNIACPRSVLRQALKQLKEEFKEEIQ